MKVQALQLSTLLLLLGGMLPPVAWCWDEAIVPKWTMCMLAVIVLLNCVALALAIALTYCKSQSTSGRRFILARSLNLIAHHPIIGNGTGGFDRNYMLEQASFFQQNPQDPHGMLADDVHHPLSEFVYAWVEHGVGGAVLLASCIVYCHARAFSLCMLPFLLFSYPLNYPLAWVVLLGNTALRLHKYVGFLPFKTNGVAMNVISCVAFAIWLYFLSLDIRMSMANNSAKMKAHSHAVRKYSSLEAEMSLIPAVSLHQKRFSCYLYNYTYELFQARRFESAWHLYEQERGHFASYDSELLAGDILYQQALQSENHEAMIDNAAIHYELARCMCPVRFAPLEGLMRLYSLDTSNSHKADSVARLIIAKPIKVPSVTVSRIKEKAIERISRRQHDISDQTE